MTSIKYILVTVLAAKVCIVQAQTNRAAAPTDYSKIQQHIADRNIFDPNRVPDRVFPTGPKVRTTPQPQPNSFSLVGTMNYGEGDTAGIYAFFDGTSTQFRKAAVLNDSIAGFKIVAIDRDSVTLVQSTNKIVLMLGDQMRDDTKGHWQVFGQTMAAYPSGGMGRNQTFGAGFDGGGRNRGRNNNGNYNYGNNSFRTGMDQNATQFNRNQRNDQRGGSNAATQDFPQDLQDPGFGGLLDGGPMIIIPDFPTPPDDAPAE